MSGQVNGPGLLTLQLVDVELDHLASTERRLPERATLEAAQAAHRTWRGDRDRLAAVVDEASASIARAEQESATIDAKRARLQQQLKTIIAPREAEALMHEIEVLEANRSALDDTELEAMEVQSEAEAAILALDDQEPALVGALDAAQAELDAALARVAAEREQLLARRSAAEAALEPEDLASYAQLRVRFGGVGIVQLEGRRCSGCHLDLSAGEADVVKSAPPDQLPECPHCGRLIVR